MGTKCVPLAKVGLLGPCLRVHQSAVVRCNSGNPGPTVVQWLATARLGDAHRKLERLRLHSVLVRNDAVHRWHAPADQWRHAQHTQPHGHASSDCGRLDNLHSRDRFLWWVGILDVRLFAPALCYGQHRERLPAALAGTRSKTSDNGRLVDGCKDPGRCCSADATARERLRQEDGAVKRKRACWAVADVPGAPLFGTSSDPSCGLH